jgi:hypothetical protein
MSWMKTVFKDASDILLFCGYLFMLLKAIFLSLNNVSTLTGEVPNPDVPIPLAAYLL